ncbi:muscle M-line assembly protein unc-89-like [Culicoides brevitarsis]|uniref:muscle M-line assembly protein unc-89-like n=1 Tax=Culicoides brevitarsis TaxID=469753 RepID=UPI00307BF1AA
MENLAPEVVDLAESPVVIPEKESEPTPETANLAPETIILEESPVIATTEDDYLAKLCAESGVAPKMTPPMSETNNETIDMEETAANDTFEIKDSVFGEDISAPTPAKSTETSTIVIEDTPLKPKTPQITMRRPFRRQQNLEMPDALSVSCIGEKSILKRKKRSLSTGDIRVNMTMQERRVKFHSPANQTVHINEIDDRLLKSFTETNDRHQRAARRKRSLSDADYTLLKKENSAKKTFKSKKMPDFASIHSKQINKMESIADNLARKQERAMALTTPDRKKAPSDTKNDLSTEVPSTSTEIASSTILTHISEEKIDEPKQKVEETPIETEQIEEQPAPVLDSEPNHKKSAIPKPMTSIKPQKSDEKPKKPLGQIQFKAKIQFATERKKVEGQKTPVFNFAARSAVADIKRGKENGLVKPVNLVSKLNSTTQAAGGSTKTHIPMPSTSQTATKAKSSREERHKNLYKANKLCGNGKEGGKGLLQGVRLNKRFELQMAYRNMKKE